MWSRRRVLADDLNLSSTVVDSGLFTGERVGEMTFRHRVAGCAEPQA
jgi:hypothetical protein